MKFNAVPPKEYRGSTSDDVAVRFIGLQPNGSANLQLNIRAPETPDDDPAATERQLRAVGELFPHIPPTISFLQAHALLCYRDYALAVVDRVLPALADDQRRLWITIIATLVSHDERVAKDVRRWSDDRFREARTDPRVTRTKHFSDLMVVCYDLACDMGLIKR